MGSVESPTCWPRLHSARRAAKKAMRSPSPVLSRVVVRSGLSRLAVLSALSVSSQAAWSPMWTSASTASNCSTKPPVSVGFDLDDDFSVSSSRIGSPCVTRIPDVLQPAHQPGVLHHQPDLRNFHAQRVPLLRS